MPLRAKAAAGVKRLDKGWRLVLGAEERKEGNVARVRLERMGVI